MHNTSADAVALAREIVEKTAGAKNVEVVVCPTFTSLAAVGSALTGSHVQLGAQNLHWEVQGAFTGEISGAMLKEQQCEYVIVGHSERRQFFGETDETVSRRLKAAFAAGLIPILCVGETLQEREAGLTERVVDRQLAGALKGFSKSQIVSLIIAYEPVWAIGTGRTASAADANAVCKFIRKTFERDFDAEAAETLRIQYGGSVKPDNVDELMAESDIDGALVGGASLKAADFARIVKFIS